MMTDEFITAHEEAMRDAAIAEDAWRTSLAENDTVERIAELFADAEAAGLHEWRVRLEVYGLTCGVCMGRGDVPTGELHSTPSSPAETTFDECPKCLGSGLVMPKSKSRS